MKIKKIHHVAYRCIDARQTVEWYVKYLNMDFVLAIAEDRVPSTGAPDPYMHVFLDAGAGNVPAFFELPNRLELAVNTGTPEMMAKLDAVKWDMLDEWAHTRKAPQHAAWMHATPRAPA